MFITNNVFVTEVSKFSVIASSIMTPDLSSPHLVMKCLSTYAWPDTSNNTLGTGGTCLHKLSHHGLGNGLLLIRHQAITWINDDLLSFEPLGTNFCENLIKIQTSIVTEMHLEMWSVKCPPFGSGHTVFIVVYTNRYWRQGRFASVLSGTIYYDWQQY